MIRRRLSSSCFHKVSKCWILSSWFGVEVVDWALAIEGVTQSTRKDVLRRVWKAQGRVGTPSFVEMEEEAQETRRGLGSRTPIASFSLHNVSCRRWARWSDLGALGRVDGRFRRRRRRGRRSVSDVDWAVALGKDAFHHLGRALRNGVVVESTWC